MQRISIDGIFSDINFGLVDTGTSTLQSGKYVTCLYDNKWYIGVIVGRRHENNDIKVTAIQLESRSDQQHFLEKKKTMAR